MMIVLSNEDLVLSTEDNSCYLMNGVDFTSL